MAVLKPSIGSAKGDPFDRIRGSRDFLAAARNAVVGFPLDLAGESASEVFIRGNLDLRRTSFALGFERTAYAGPETGVRDRASYVLEQGEIRLVLTSGVRADSEIVRFAATHGDAAKDVALQVPDVGAAYREAVSRGSQKLQRCDVEIDRQVVEDFRFQNRPQPAEA